MTDPHGACAVEYVFSPAQDIQQLVAGIFVLVAVVGIFQCDVDCVCVVSHHAQEHAGLQSHWKQPTGLVWQQVRVSSEPDFTV